MPNFNIPNPDPRDLDGTQPGKPVRIPAPIPPQPAPLPPRDRQTKSSEKAKRKRDAPTVQPHDRRNSGLYIPIWSVLLTLVFVSMIAFAVVALILGLGGRSAPGGDPVLVIITAIPSSTAPIPQFQPTSAAPTLPGINASVPQFPLEGPTLIPVRLTATPVPLAVGVRVRTSGDGVNVRPSAGTDNTPLFIANAADVFTIVEGPVDLPDNVLNPVWWRVQDVRDPQRVGWIAANLLVVAPPE